MGVDAVMKFKTEYKLSDLELRQASGKLHALLDKDCFFLDKLGKYGQPDKEHILQYDEDCNLINIRLSGRYYGPGYERGPLIIYITIADWLELNLKATVFYGADSRDSIELFDKEARQEIYKYFLINGHEPYRAYSIKEKETPLCSFCGGKPFHDVGGGGARTFWHCDGCDTHLISEPGKENQEVEKFF